MFIIIIKQTKRNEKSLYSFLYIISVKHYLCWAHGHDIGVQEILACHWYVTKRNDKDVLIFWLVDCFAKYVNKYQPFCLIVSFCLVTRAEHLFLAIHFSYLSVLIGRVFASEGSWKVNGMGLCSYSHSLGVFFFLFLYPHNYWPLCT